MRMSERWRQAVRRWVSLQCSCRRRGGATPQRLRDARGFRIGADGSRSARNCGDQPGVTDDVHPATGAAHPKRMEDTDVMTDKPPQVAGSLAGSLASAGARQRTVWSESQVRNYVAPLSGGEEVPANASMGRGTAIFQLSADGTQLDYRITASNIDNVHMAARFTSLPAAGVEYRRRGVAVPTSTAAGHGPLGSGRHDGVLRGGDDHGREPGRRLRR